ncbi:hypothetical protein [Psychroflexus sp. ALD_RP9]|uniref:hypothetical protein n=1 Tax=Psychroflexus sp. ALD_RP9 TaxID=2777186 RepID=UPI001A8FB79D|nr:hypothetical protein [Psychroflexus sp. ALD_RP9]QSS97170.1 hypothetical protein IMZ30_00160 [Psychroflexus sp. ALD_RP9]
MKSITTFALAILVSLQSIGVSAANVLNLSTFYEHYKLHQTETDCGFSEFLDLHYGSQKNEHANEHEEHENLPFQECHHLTHNFYVEPIHVSYLSIKIPAEDIQHNFKYSLLLNSLRETEILQPPKF